MATAEQKQSLRNRGIFSHQLWMKGGGEVPWNKECGFLRTVKIKDTIKRLWPVFPAQNETTLSRRSKEREHIQQKINQSVKFRN